MSVHASVLCYHGSPNPSFTTAPQVTAWKAQGHSHPAQRQTLHYKPKQWLFFQKACRNATRLVWRPAFMFLMELLEKWPVSRWRRFPAPARQSRSPRFQALPLRSQEEAEQRLVPPAFLPPESVIQGLRKLRQSTWWQQEARLACHWITLGWNRQQMKEALTLVYEIKFQSHSRAGRVPGLACLHWVHCCMEYEHTQLHPFAQRTWFYFYTFGIFVNICFFVAYVCSFSCCKKGNGDSNNLRTINLHEPHKQFILKHQNVKTLMPFLKCKLD